MWQSIIEWLLSFSPVVSIIIVFALFLGYMLYTITIYRLRKAEPYEELQKKVLNLYHESLEDIHTLRIEVDEQRETLYNLKANVHRLKLTLLDIRKALYTLKDNYPQINGDLDIAIKKINQAIDKMR